MTKEQILTALAPLYQDAIDKNNSISVLYVQAVETENDREARAMSRKLSKSFGFLDGLSAAAKALGVTTEELIIAAGAAEVK